MCIGSGQVHQVSCMGCTQYSSATVHLINQWASHQPRELSVTDVQVQQRAKLTATAIEFHHVHTASFALHLNLYLKQ